MYASGEIGVGLSGYGIASGVFGDFDSDMVLCFVMRERNKSRTKNGLC